MAAVRRSGRVTPAVLLVLALLAPAVAACSSSSKPAASGGTSAASSPTGAAGSSTGATGQTTTVTVTEKEFSLTPSQTQFAPGSYTFVASNGGSVTHALAISGPGVSTTQTSSVPPGGSARFTVTLQQGSYELWCPIDDHKALGMDLHIQVGGAASGSPTASGSATTSSTATGSPMTSSAAGATASSSAY
ncbi:hypothetical protein ACFW1A_31940 [Kitasatospora sp. NPDC058965]|uniref:hypothetical protein n=1 Tax=Kitasatospora sp. NPDC058965 TaxID=3346682 RepID=UPI003691146C